MFFNHYFISILSSICYETAEKSNLSDSNVVNDILKPKADRIWKKEAETL